MILSQIEWVNKISQLPLWGRIKVGVIAFAHVKRFGKNSQEKTDRGRKAIGAGYVAF